MPFGGESCEDCNSSGMARSASKRHQCLSAGSPVRTVPSLGLASCRIESPMPFGGESCEDALPLPSLSRGRDKSPMPFGGESCEDKKPKYENTRNEQRVTNAFRRGVL